MSKKHILLFVAFFAMISVISLSMAADYTDLTNLSKMSARNSSAPYDGEERIAKALKIAKQTGKRVLVQSSAEGCTWCHVLHNLLTSNQEIRTKIDHDFIYVLVDTTNDKNRDFYKKYAQNTDHTLVLVVLDGDGKEFTQSIGFDIVQLDPQSNSYHIAPEHILSFLNDWSPKSL